TCSLNVTHCIFSCPKSIPLDQRDSPDLIHQTDTTEERSVRYVGRRNCYHNLNAFWVRSAAQAKARQDDWDGFKAAIKEDGGYDESSSLLTRDRPWASPDVLGERDPGAAFKINTKLPELRRTDQPLRAIGVEKCILGISNESLPKADGDP